MRYLTVQSVFYGGTPSDLEPRLDALMGALDDLAKVDPDIVDPDLGASLATCQVDVQMVVEADDPPGAAVKAAATLRAAIHAIGDATPGWNTRQAAIRVEPNEAAEPAPT